MQWLSDHLATILICAALIAVVALILRNLIRAHRSGKSSCGGDCAHCGGGCAHGGSSRPVPGRQTVTLTLHVDGMRCGMCEAHLCDTLRQLFSVRSVKASYKTGTVLLRAQRDISDSDLHAAIDGTGYTLLSVTRK